MTGKTLRTATLFATRELRGGFRKFWVLLACLALGVAAITAVGSVRAAIEAGLQREGAALLGGDAEMEFTYRFATDDEQDWMRNNSVAQSEIVDFRSMAVVTRDGVTERGLTQVKAVDDAYPLVGQIALTPAMPLSQALQGRDGLPGGVMAPVLADRLGLSVGDQFQLGTQPFVLMARIAKEPDNATGGFGLGPRTLVATDALAQSGLLKPGSLYETKYRLILPDRVDLAQLSDQANDRFAETGMRWRDSRNGAPGVARFVERLGAFLILVGLSGLAVGGVGVSASVRAYLSQKTSVIATLRSLGADRGMIFLTYFLQIGVLSLIGIVIGLVLGALAPVALSPVLLSQLPVPAVFGIYPAPLIEAACYGLLTALIFTIWPLARTEDIRAATLFRDGGQSGQGLPRPIWVAATVFLLTALIGAAATFSGAWALTLWTSGGLILALGLLALAAWLIGIVAKRLRPLTNKRPALRWALGAISARKAEAVSVVLSLGLGLTVMSAIGQIDGNLRGAIAQDLPGKAPSYFILDIQRDQMPGVLGRITNDPEISRHENAPMLRGVITRINDKPAAEVAGDHWVVRGDRAVTYANTIPEGTTLTQGEWWPENYEGPPQISFAQEEATEIGLRLGDTITMNILGRDITGTITSFREVDFSTAGMGFVMVMNEAALRGAPHSYIATIYAAPSAEAAILRDLANAFPNITAIRVRDAIDRVTEVLDGLAAATRWGASATLLTGFLVLIGAAAAGNATRVYEAAILRTLGASRRRILLSFALRSALLGLGAGLVALVSGIIGGWAVSRFVFDTSFAIVWPSALAIVAGGALANLATGLAFAWFPLAVRPAPVLRARE